MSAISPNSVGVIDPKTNELVAEVRVGARPGPVAAGEGAVWVANLDDETVSRVDPETREVVRTFSAGGYPGDVAVSEGAAWVFLSQLYDLTRIDAALNEAEELELKVDAAAAARGGGSGGPCGAQQVTLAVGGGHAWIACDYFRLFRADLRTGAVADTGFDVGGVFVPVEFADIAFGLGSAWVVNRAANTVTEIDAAGNQALVPTAITVGQSPYAVAVGLGSLWVANREDDTVTRIEPGVVGVPAVTTIAVGDGPIDVAVGEGAVWTANSLDGTVSRIDPETNELVAVIEVGDDPYRVAAGEGAVWVTLRGLV